MVAPGPATSRSGQQQARLALLAAALLLLALWRASQRQQAAAVTHSTGTQPDGPAMACPRELDNWRRMHATLAAEVQEADAGLVRGRGWASEV